MTRCADGFEIGFERIRETPDFGMSGQKIGKTVGEAG